jgi:hypothetical protein
MKWYKPVRWLLYICIAATLVNTWTSAIKADETGAGFSDVAMFGTWWPLVLIVLIAGVAMLHLASNHARAAEDPNETERV